MTATGRAYHGVNLAGWLSMESWATPELFADSGALDESSLISVLGQERYRELVNAHRESFITQADFVQIAGRGFNAVRLVVPWYVFGDEGPDTGSYIGCIEKVDDAFNWAEDVGLKLLLVLGINPGDEQRESNPNHRHARFIDYRSDMVQVLKQLAERYALREGLIGFELASTPHVRSQGLLRINDGVSLHELRTYYRDAYQAIRSAAGEDPVIVLPTAGKAQAWRSFMAQHRYSNVWLDIHLHHYNDNTDALGPVGTRLLVDASSHSLDLAKKAGLPVMVGEWSGSLPFPDSLMTPEGRIALERVYIAEQLAAFSACPAWFFQTWKTSGRLPGWDARVSLATFERRMLD